MLCLCKQENICVSLSLHVSLRKSSPDTGVKSRVFFTFFTFDQEQNLLPDCGFRLFTDVCCENCMLGFSD